MNNPYEKIKSIKQRRRAFLKDIKEFYNSNNRAVNSKGTCLYQATKNSPGCAIGRWLDEKPFCDLTVNSDKVQKFLPKWMTEMGVEFLRLCQMLHDDKNNWNEQGLSQFGKEYCAGIKKQFHL